MHITESLCASLSLYKRVLTIFQCHPATCLKRSQPSDF